MNFRFQQRLFIIVIMIQILLKQILKKILVNALWFIVSYKTYMRKLKIVENWVPIGNCYTYPLNGYQVWKKGDDQILNTSLNILF